MYIHWLFCCCCGIVKTEWLVNWLLCMCGPDQASRLIHLYGHHVTSDVPLILPLEADQH